MEKVSAKKIFIDEMTKLVGSPDKFGHFKFNGQGLYTGTAFRLKIGSISWRLERKVTDRWIKLTRVYFSSEGSLTIARKEVGRRIGSND